MFECGAGWISRSKKEYLIVGIDGYHEVPEWLKNGQNIIKLRGSNILDDNIYLMIIEYINSMIEHLNIFRTSENKLKILHKDDSKIRKKIVSYWHKHIK